MRMLEISTDYLIVGAGAMGMGFLDELVTCSQLEAVIVDTRDKPGGHWNQVQYVTVQYSTVHTGTRHTPSCGSTSPHSTTAWPPAAWGWAGPTSPPGPRS